MEGEHTEKMDKAESSKAAAKAITSFEIFMLFVKNLEAEAEDVDVSGVLSQECFDMWLRTRYATPKDPPRAFKDALKTILTASNRCRPFPQRVEFALLRLLRRNRVWPCFSHMEGVNIGQRGWKIKGFHEKNNCPEQVGEKPVIRSSSDESAKEVARARTHPTSQGNGDGFDAPHCDTKPRPASASKPKENLKHMKCEHEGSLPSLKRQKCGTKSKTATKGPIHRPSELSGENDDRANRTIEKETTACDPKVQDPSLSPNIKCETELENSSSSAQSPSQEHSDGLKRPASAFPLSAAALGVTPEPGVNSYPTNGTMCLPFSAAQQTLLQDCRDHLRQMTQQVELQTKFALYQQRLARFSSDPAQQHNLASAALGLALLGQSSPPN